MGVVIVGLLIGVQSAFAGVAIMYIFFNFWIRIYMSALVHDIISCVRNNVGLIYDLYN